MNIKNQNIIWDTVVYIAWGDGDIPLFLIEDKIISLNSTFGDDIGSGLEIMVNLLDTNGMFVDSFFIDYDKKEGNSIWNARLGYDGNIYFCGENVTLPDISLPTGIWGYFSPSILLSDGTNVYFNPSIKIYPTIISKSHELTFDTDEKISSIELYNLQGRFITKLKNTNNSVYINRTGLQSGFYLLKYMIKDKFYIKKLLIN